MEYLFLRAEQLSTDLELFAQHAGRKSVNMEDVILSGEFILVNICNNRYNRLWTTVLISTTWLYLLGVVSQPSFI